jgi:hypothetical protein
MAPEQAAGAPVGPAADVFALGAVLRYVAGDSLPPGLEPLVDAALAPEPAARPSAEELHTHLSALSAGPAAPTEIAHAAPTEVAPPPVVAAHTNPAERAPWRRPAVVALAALAVIVLLLALFPRGNGNAAVAPIPAGPDPAQTARNLATWLRDQAG